MVFIKYSSVYRKLAHKLILCSVSLTYQKSIFEDYIAFGIDPDKTMLFNGAAMEDDNSEEKSFDMV